ncbi:hypothetical protein ACLOJK_031279 [Asimina triloba]
MGIDKHASFNNVGVVSAVGMKVVAAFLLAVLGGNPNPCANDLKKILGSGISVIQMAMTDEKLHSNITGGRRACLEVDVGAEADDDRIELLLSEVAGKDVAELIAAGREKFASVPSGGGGGFAIAAGGGGGAAAAAEAPAAEAKKEEKVEEKEESDEGGQPTIGNNEVMLLHFMRETASDYGDGLD